MTKKSDVKIQQGQSASQKHLSLSFLHPSEKACGLFICHSFLESQAVWIIWEVKKFQQINEMHENPQFWRSGDGQSERTQFFFDLHNKVVVFKELYVKFVYQPIYLLFSTDLSHFLKYFLAQLFGREMLTIRMWKYFLREYWISQSKDFYAICE